MEFLYYILAFLAGSVVVAWMNRDVFIDAYNALRGK